MSEVLTATELARRFGDVLAEVRHTGRVITVTKNGQPVAELRPFDSPKTCSLREFAEAWEGLNEPSDEAFADDLAAVDASDQPAISPWES